MATTKAPRREECPRCERHQSLEESGICTRCRTEEALKEARRRRHELEEAERARLGARPLSRSLNLVRLSLEAGLHWTAWALRFAVGSDVHALESVAEHLQAAYGEIRHSGRLR